MDRIANKFKVFEFLGYTPNPKQIKIHADESRIRLVAGGERSGKSFIGAQELVAHLVQFWAEGKTKGRYWIVGPDYEQANKAEFNYVHEAIKKLDGGRGVIVKESIPREGSRSIEFFDGTEIQTKTSEDVLKLASVAIDGVLMVEAAQQTWDVFQRLHNRTAERRGWMLISGTFETSRGWFPELFNTFQAPNTFAGKSFSLPTWSNLNLFPGGEQDEEILRLKATNPPEVFQERFGGEPCPPRTLVYPEFRHLSHIVPIRFGSVVYPVRDEQGWIISKDAELQVWIDPGWAGAYAVLFVAIAGPSVFVVDEIYAKGRTGEQVIFEAQNKKIRDMVHEEFGDSLWKRVRTGVIDIAGTQHQGMESHVELWQRLARIPLRTHPVPITDGISVTRRFLSDPLTGHPRIFFDPKCEKTAWEFGQYKYRLNTENRNETELPIDKDNHSLKAIAYGLFDNFRFVDRLETRKKSTYHPHIPGRINA